jgi:hypothetical protein
MYGRSEDVAGELMEKQGLRPKLFVATKVWTAGRAQGIAQMRESMRKLRAQPVDLMQVHNLVDVDTHLATLRDWKQQGVVRQTAEKGNNKPKVTMGKEFVDLRGAKSSGFDIAFEETDKVFGVVGITVRRQLFMATGTDDPTAMIGKKITLYPVKSAKSATGQAIRIAVPEAMA